VLLEADAVVIWQVTQEGGSYFGWAVSELADVDGDGVTDAITSDPFAGGYAGQVVVLSGRDGSVRLRIPGEPGALEGYGIADAGDLDGDGLHDVASGAPGASAVHVWSGYNGALLATFTGVPGEDLGAAVARAGDLDRDGVPDLVAGAESANVDAGRVYAFSGATGAPLWVVEGSPGEHLGSGAGYVGDTDGDGVPDLAVGARTAGEGGEVRLLSGADGATRFTWGDPDGGGALGQFFVAGVGDLDGDSIPDVYGGDYANPALGRATGRAFVWSGWDGATLFTFTGEPAGDGLGPGRGAGDVDGDGIPDLAIGAWRSSAGAPEAGRVTVLSGADGSALRTYTSAEAGEHFGFDAVGVGDADGDGAIDLLVSAATGQRVYLVGSPAPAEPPPTTDPVDPADPAERGCGCGSGRSALLVALYGLIPRRRSSSFATVAASIARASSVSDSTSAPPSRTRR
jgi:hypothetical protein